MLLKTYVVLYMYNENLSTMSECCIIYFLLLGLSTEETILSSLTNLSYQSSSAATSSLEQFFSSLLSSITTRGSELFSELQTLKVVFDAVCTCMCVWSVLNTCVQYVLCLRHVHCYLHWKFILSIVWYFVFL